ncbi:hypothetical protein BDU57DRAFT_575604 [Ampelomyces quisqualis]|uniref:Uncharacterized protein n=1 Tax=Ampelomyces quisqualis TaxID=50730 RepID=A0A6A5QNP9_AMPQU|nr:hypothetical protein BDU57DRAFT_575604 [Ampelomyces quisqualis]
MSSPIPDQAPSNPPPQAPSIPPYPLAQVLLPIWPAPYLATIFQQISPHLTHSNFKIYIQHFELFRRDLLTKDMFNTGATTIYPIINTPVLEDLQAVLTQLLHHQEEFRQCRLEKILNTSWGLQRFYWRGMGMRGLVKGRHAGQDCASKEGSDRGEH